jgi:3-isopropylmalate/(R)-2-methylmalate dehydratase small subunit
MNKFNTLTSSIAVLDIENIDTDQIIGSDHLKITNKEGLGQHLFSDWRYNDDGTEKQTFVLNQAKTKQACVLVAGDNFGCGSSREHAPWALLDYGIKVVISSSIADIFSNNAVKNGLLPIKVSKEQHLFLLSKNACQIEVNLADKKLMCGERTFDFEIENFARFCLINGIDQLDFLTRHEQQIATFENSRH